MIPLNVLLIYLLRFEKISVKGILNKESFRDSLGLLGLEPGCFLADRIFNALDEDNDGVLNYDDFLSYLNILINGAEREKAALSFKIIDNEKKGKITYKDIEDMMIGISNLWNSLTDSEVLPKKEYIDYIFGNFDSRKANEVLFNEYFFTNSDLI